MSFQFSTKSFFFLLEQEGEIERQLADFTFEELQKAKSYGSHLVYQKSNEEKKAGRANKNRYFCHGFIVKVFSFNFGIVLLVCYYMCGSW